MNPRSRAHRTLKKLSRYHPADGPDPYVPSWIGEWELGADEALLGVYENHPGSLDQAVLVTDRALLIWEGEGWVRVDYSRIARARTPGRKEGLSEIHLEMFDGAEVAVPIKGGDSRFRDAFGFLRFINRVVGDLEVGER